MLLSDKNGAFSLQVAEGAQVAVAVTALGYQDSEAALLPDTVLSPLIIRLKEAAISSKLEEVTVTADRSQTVKRTANGQIFYLSGKAKKETNPFMALAEIPLLISDFSTSSVKLLNGKMPLILVDGNQVNSGINPISPEDIESVEVITSVPARYLQEGYGGIVNIRLKKNRAPYVWFGLSMEQGMHYFDSGPGANFEVGNEKFSVYGAGIYKYIRNGETQSRVNRSNVGYSQSFTSLTRTSSDQWLGWILMKYLPTPKDYLSVSLRYNDSSSRSGSKAEGEFAEEATLPYASEGSDRNVGRVASASLYYKHAFADYNSLELTASFNSNTNNLDSRSEETVGEATNDYVSEFHNSRKSALFKADYSKTFDSGFSMAFGNHLTSNFDRIDQQRPENPLFHHRKLNEYLYGSISGAWRKLYYTLSAGLEAIWLKAGDADNHYLRPRANASGTWLFNRSHSLQLSYTLTNETPSIALLNPYNTSTDPLVISSGNPLLKPKTEQEAALTYTFNKKGFYLSPQLIFLHDRDLISPWGYTEEDVYHSTYRNFGHYSEMNYFLTASYNAPWCTVTAYGGWTNQYFSRLPAKGYFQTYASLFFRVKKFYFILEAEYKDRSHTENSSTRYYKPVQSRFHVSYNFTPDFYVAVGIYNYLGTQRSVVDLSQGSFSSSTEVFDRTHGHGFSPYVRFYYNFRKNKKRKIKFNNPNFEEESGINLRN